MLTVVFKLVVIQHFNVMRDILKIQYFNFKIYIIIKFFLLRLNRLLQQLLMLTVVFKLVEIQHFNVMQDMLKIQYFNFKIYIII